MHSFVCFWEAGVATFAKAQDQHMGFVLTCFTSGPPSVIGTSAMEVTVGLQAHVQGGFIRGVIVAHEQVLYDHA